MYINNYLYHNYVYVILYTHTPYFIYVKLARCLFYAPLLDMMLHTLY